MAAALLLTSTQNEKGKHMETGPQATQRDVSDSTFLSVIMHPVRTQLAIARVLAIVSGVLSIFPYVALVHLGDVLVRAWVDNQLPDRAAVSHALWLLIGTFAARLATHLIALFISHLADVKLSAALRIRMTESLGRAPLSWFTENTSGHVRKAMQDDISALHMLVAHKPVDMTVAVVSPIALGAYAFAVDWRLGLLAVAVVPVYFGVYAFTMRGMGEKLSALDIRMDRLSATMVEYLAGINVVKAFGTVGKAHSRYAAHAKDTCDYFERWSRPLSRASAISLVFISAPLVLLINLTGGYLLVSAGQVSVADVIATSLIALLLPQTIETIGTATWYYQIAAAAANRMKATMSAPVLEEATAPAVVPDGYRVRFEHVSVNYGETHALTDVTLELDEGTVTALVGPSGSGKSTLAKLVARFQDPASGSVHIGDVDVRDIDGSTLYRTVSFVLQDAQLIRASIRDNIALTRPEATLEQVTLVAQRARIHDDIVSLPRGYDTIIGEDTELSGGQQQRIAIARALLADTPILVLDEATAMTDPETEAHLQAAITELTLGRTVLVIAHRMSSIAGVDRIAILQRGHLVACGTPAELVDVPLLAGMTTPQYVGQGSR